MRASLVGIAAIAAVSGNALAQGFFDPPGFPFNLYTQNTNDGYGGSRGVFFSVNAPVNANNYSWTNDMPPNASLQWELRENGNVVDTEFSSTGGGGNTDYSVNGNGYLMQPGFQYEISVQHNDNGVGNYFYDYNGNPQFDVGVFHVIDGTAGHDGGNTVMPRMGINAVPSPASAGLLGLAGLVAGRRRR